MLDFKKAITEYYEREMAAIKRFNLDEINEAMNAILDTYENGGIIYVCGNGGSASTASHMQNDFNKGISEYTEKKFNFYCLNDNVSTMMAVANDIGYEEVFRFPLLNKITNKDLFVGISGSGNSKNVLNAAEYASCICSFSCPAIFISFAFPALLNIPSCPDIIIILIPASIIKTIIVITSAINVIPF